MRVKLEPYIEKGIHFAKTADWQRAVENAGNMSAKAVKVDFQVTTKTWTHKPDFIIEHATNSGVWEVFTNDKIYTFVSEGTRPHVISARNAPTLRFFSTGFRPKSRPGWIGSNKGARATKNFRTPKTVHHPGNAPRKFTETIHKKWEREWPMQISRAIQSISKYGGA